MIDIVEIAKGRRATFAAEISRLDDFVCTAAALVEYSQSLGCDPVMDADADHFTSDGEALVSEDELVLTEVQSNDDAPLGAHAGEKIRHRRWMLGITQRQLGEIVGIEFEKIQSYETGTDRINASSMRDIAAALEVPVSYFLEDLDGQSPDTGEVCDDILTDR